MCVLLKLTAVSRFQTIPVLYVLCVYVIVMLPFEPLHRALFTELFSGSSCRSYQIFYAGYCILHWHAVNFMLCWEGGGRGSSLPSHQV